MNIDEIKYSIDDGDIGKLERDIKSAILLGTEIAPDRKVRSVFINTGVNSVDLLLYKDDCNDIDCRIEDVSMNKLAEEIHSTADSCAEWVVSILLNYWGKADPRGVKNIKTPDKIKCRLRKLDSIMNSLGIRMSNHIFNPRKERVYSEGKVKFDERAKHYISQKEAYECAEKFYKFRIEYDRLEDELKELYRANRFSLGE